MNTLKPPFALISFVMLSAVLFSACEKVEPENYDHIIQEQEQLLTGIWQSKSLNDEPTFPGKYEFHFLEDGTLLSITNSGYHNSEQRGTWEMSRKVGKIKIFLYSERQPYWIIHSISKHELILQAGNEKYGLFKH